MSGDPYLGALRNIFPVIHRKQNEERVRTYNY